MPFNKMAEVDGEILTYLSSNESHFKPDQAVTMIGMDPCVNRNPSPFAIIETKPKVEKLKHCPINQSIVVCVQYAFAVLFRRGYLWLTPVLFCSALLYSVWWWLTGHATIQQRSCCCMHCGEPNRGLCVLCTAPFTLPNQTHRLTL